MYIFGRLTGTSRCRSKPHQTNPRRIIHPPTNNRKCSRWNLFLSRSPRDSSYSLSYSPYHWNRLVHPYRSFFRRSTRHLTSAPMNRRGSTDWWPTGSHAICDSVLLLRRVFFKEVHEVHSLILDHGIHAMCIEIAL